jgi:ubiquinone/menaquinone biosynthesis C-methylase UbiE
MTTLQYDEHATQRLVAIYATPDVVAQRARFPRALAPRSGDRIVDGGAGPGFLEELIAEEAGPSGFVAGVDISEPLPAYANAHRAQPERVEFRRGDGIRLPYAESSFDAATCTQVLEYIADVDAASAELDRVVRAGGRVAILDTDWDSIVRHAPERDRMQRVLAARQTHVPHARLPRTLARRLRRAGFRVDAPQVIALFNPDYDPDTYNNRIVDLIVAFVAGRGVTAAEATAWAQELRGCGAQGHYFFSPNR